MQAHVPTITTRPNLSPKALAAVAAACAALGAGAVGTVMLINDDDPVVQQSPASGASVAPVPERVSPAPAVASGAAASSSAPVPERVSPAPAVASGAAASSSAPVPERVTDSPAITLRRSGTVVDTAPQTSSLAGTISAGTISEEQRNAAERFHHRLP